MGKSVPKKYGETLHIILCTFCNLIKEIKTKCMEVCILYKYTYFTEFTYTTQTLIEFKLCSL